MSIVSPRSDVLPPSSGQEDARWTFSTGSDRRRPEPAPLTAPRSLALQERAFAEAMANSGGLGDSAEEITFGIGERAELEAHDETRDARERQEDRVEALMRVGAIQEMMRQIAGEQAYASIKWRAERFADLWMKGATGQAMAELEAGGPGPERELLLRLALHRLPTGPQADQLVDTMGDLSQVSQTLIRRLMQRPDDRTSGSPPEAQATRTALQVLTQAPPSVKRVLDAADTVGPRGLDKLQSAATPHRRVDSRCSRGAEVYLSLTLIRMIQQVRQVEQVSTRVMRAGACAGADSAEEIRKTARWLLDVTCAVAPQAALERMSVVLKVKADALLSAQLQLRRDVDHELPHGVWINEQTRGLVQEGLARAITLYLEDKGFLNRAGRIINTARLRSGADGQATAVTPSFPDAAPCA